MIARSDSIFDLFDDVSNATQPHRPSPQVSAYFAPKEWREGGEFLLREELVFGAWCGLSEDHNLRKQKIKTSRDAECCEVAEHNAPAKNLLEKEQKEHLDTKTRQRGDVECCKMSPKGVAIAVTYATAPYPKVGAEEIAHYGALERDDGRDNIGGPIATPEHKVSHEPHHERIYTRAKCSAEHKFEVFGEH